MILSNRLWLKPCSQNNQRPQIKIRAPATESTNGYTIIISKLRQCSRKLYHSGRKRPNFENLKKHLIAEKWFLGPNAT